MSIAAAMLPEFEYETATTRRVLDRIPAEIWDWKAHEKSNSVRWNACHLAEIVGWMWGAIADDSWDLDPPGGEPYKTPDLASPQEAVALLDENFAKAKEALASVTDEQMMATWRLLKGGEVLIEMPRVAALRTWVLNHMIHHRAVVTVYLRLNDVPVPAIYGPSGDEAP